MAADVESEAAIFDGARQPADIVRISFENLGMMAMLGELVSCRQACRPGTDNDHALMSKGIQLAFRPRSAIGTLITNRESSRPFRIVINLFKSWEHYKQLKTSTYPNSHRIRSKYI